MSTISAALRPVPFPRLAALRADPATAEHADADSVERNRRLLWAWDTISLAVLLRWAPLPLEDVPLEGGGLDRLALGPAGEQLFTLDPWPFSTPTVTLRCEGRRLEGSFDEQDEMRAALARAPWVTLKVELRPAG